MNKRVFVLFEPNATYIGILGKRNVIYVVAFTKISEASITYDGARHSFDAGDDGLEVGHNVTFFDCEA